MSNTKANRDVPILVIDDTRLSIAVIKKCLMSGGYTRIYTAPDASRGMDLIEKHNISIVVADWLMPGMDGLTLTQKIRHMDELNQTYTYVLMLTAKESPEDMSAAFEHGIDDFINKSRMQEQLISRIQPAVRIMAHYQQHLQQNRHLTKVKSLLESQNTTLKSQSLIDSLTGLGNQTFALQRLETHLKQLHSRGGSCSLLLLHVDSNNRNFRQLPTTILQEVITGVGKSLRNLIRPLDDLARISTFEFLIIINDPDDTTPNPLSFKRILDAINHREFKTPMGFQPVRADISLVTLNAGAASPTAEEMIEKARSLTPVAKNTTRIECYAYGQQVSSVTPNMQR